MKIAYFGLPLAALLLDRDGHQLGLAVLSPLRAPGLRRLRARLADRLIEDPGQDPEGISERLRQLRPDLIVSWFFTRRIPESWLGLAKQGGIGAHPSLLPRHRGPNPFFWCIDGGDAETGVSIHRLSGEYDTGAVLAQYRVAMRDENAWQLARALDRPSIALLRATVGRRSPGEQVEEVVQDEAAASWAAEPSGASLRVDWSWPSERVLRRIRALSPVPGLALELHGCRFFVVRASPSAAAVPTLEPGEASLVRVGGALQLQVRTGDGAITIEQAQLEVGDYDLQSLGAAELCQALLQHAPQMISSVADRQQP